MSAPDVRGLVVVGASLAGLRAAESARRSGYRGSITLIGAEKHLPYARPPLSKTFLTHETEATYYVTEDDLRDGLDIDLRLGLRATSLDPSERLVHTTDGVVPYRRLVIATGANPRPLTHLKPKHKLRLLRTLDDAAEVRAAIRSSANVVVVGAGFIGSEIASSARACGAQVTIVEAAPVPLVRALGDVVGQALSGLHERNGTRLLCDTQVTDLLGADDLEAVALSNGEVVRAEAVVVGIGVLPATSWLIGSGIQLDPLDGAVVCDEYMESSLPGVYAAGDVAQWHNLLLDSTMRLENWTNAADQAARAAINALFPEMRASYETVPYFWSDWYGQRIQFVGTAVADRVIFASGGPDADKFVALFGRGERLVGVAALNEPAKIMKYRRFIAQRGRWDVVAEGGSMSTWASQFDRYRTLLTRREIA